MKRKNITRRDLLKRSAALGMAATSSVATLWGLAGCNAKNAAGAEATAWRELPSPVPPGSISPRVTAQPDQTVILSWLEPKEDRTAALRFSAWRREAWSEPATIVSGQTISRDQAAAPAVIGLSAQNLVAYWSQKPSDVAPSGNEIALYMAASSDGGKRWTPPALVNRATAQPGEDNSYASAVALDESRAAFIWLDGRNWAEQKRVQLMSRVVALGGALSEPALLDPDTCTCCSTALVKTSTGLLAAYRGHTPDNIRDISLVRTTANAWSQARIPHPDHWHIEACPVNGPHLDAQADRVAMVWFSAPGDQPAVKLAFSQNGGADFAPFVRIDNGKAVGRAQVVLLPRSEAIAFWLESESGAAHLLARTVKDDNTTSAPLELYRGTNLGYPHAARAHEGVLVTWAERTDVSRVHTGLLRIG